MCRAILTGACIVLALGFAWAALPAETPEGPSPEALCAQAEEHVGAGRYGDAAALLERAVELAPESWRAWALLGFCRLKERRFAAALEACTRARELRPEDARAALWAAVCLKELRRYDEAARAYARLLESEPGRATQIECHWGLAECMQALGKDDEAERHLEEVTKRDGRRGRILDATLRMRRGDFAEASRRFERLFRVDDEEPMILYGLAMCLLKLNREQEFALRLLEQVEGAADLDPTDVLLGRALALIKLARHEEASELVKQLDAEIELTPEQQAVREEVAAAIKTTLGE
jgi:tetratricopeptide (TPR) repeat protein